LSHSSRGLRAPFFEQLQSPFPVFFFGRGALGDIGRIGQRSFDQRLMRRQSVHRGIEHAFGLCIEVVFRH
jgi:hypothetical protein